MNDKVLRWMNEIDDWKDGLSKKCKWIQDRKWKCLYIQVNHSITRSLTQTFHHSIFQLLNPEITQTLNHSFILLNPSTMHRFNHWVKFWLHLLNNRQSATDRVTFGSQCTPWSGLTRRTLCSSWTIVTLISRWTSSTLTDTRKSIQFQFHHKNCFILK